MAFQFPPNPTDGQLFNPLPGITYRFTTPAWYLVTSNFVAEAPADGNAYVRKNAAWTFGVERVGNQDITINKASPVLFLDKLASGASSLIRGRLAGANRWGLNLGNATAETGSNVGSDFSLSRQNDAGTNLGNALLISRATGVSTFAAAVNVPAEATGTQVPQMQEIAAAMRGHLGGYGLENNGTDAVNDIDIAVGSAVDGEAQAFITLTGALTKQLDVAWAAGSNAGMRDTGALVDGTWHIFAIKNPTTFAVDVLASLSPTTPTMPTGYTLKRRIGSIVRVSSSIRLFSQSGNEFLWETAVPALTIGNPGAAAITVTPGVPTGIKVDAFVFTASNSSTGAGSAVYLSSFDVNDEAATINVASVVTDIDGPTASVQGGATLYVRTNTSGQFRARLNSSDGGTTLWVTTFGYIDTRGQG